MNDRGKKDEKKERKKGQKTCQVPTTYQLPSDDKERESKSKPETKEVPWGINDMATGYQGGGSVHSPAQLCTARNCAAFKTLPKKV